MSQAVKTEMSALNVRGKVEYNAPLGERGWFKCGGKADLLFKPADIKDLQDFLRQIPKEMPVIALGGIANTIVRDGGVRGAVIRMGKEFASLEVDDQARITSGTAALNMSVASFAAREGVGGLEFYCGIPGSVGGALRMNAGSYGTETKDILVTAKAVTREGEIIDLTAEDMGMSYRHNDMPEETIFVQAIYQGLKEDPAIIQARIEAIKEKKSETQPLGEKTGGSTFANPSPEQLIDADLPAGTKVWQLIGKVGGRGLRIGGAMMSEKHCNFMINTGEATATDLEDLGEEIRRRVKDDCGIDLRWEVKRIGERA